MTPELGNVAELVSKFIGRGIKMPPPTPRETKSGRRFFFPRSPKGQALTNSQRIRRRAQRFLKQGLTSTGKPRVRRANNLGQAKDRNAYMQWYRRNRHLGPVEKAASWKAFQAEKLSKPETVAS